MNRRTSIGHFPWWIVIKTVSASIRKSCRTMPEIRKRQTGSDPWIVHRSGLESENKRRERWQSAYIRSDKRRWKRLSYRNFYALHDGKPDFFPFTWQVRSTQQVLQQVLLRPLTPVHALTMPSFFQVKGSILSNLRKFGLIWTKAEPKQNCWTSLLDLMMDKDRFIIIHQ